MITTLKSPMKALLLLQLGSSSSKAPSTRGGNGTVSGFTLLESLIAMVVVATLLTAIAPMLAITVAARTQALRVDRANQAARSYIDGVRSGQITIPARPTGVTETTKARELETVAALTNWTSDSATRVDSNGNVFNVSDPADLVIQAIRNGCASTGCTDGTPASQRGFDIVVRVYRADAFDSSGAAIVTLQKNTPSSTFTGTLGSKAAPLAVMASDATSNTTRLNNYNQRALGN
jgi:prepilin-type N-terminal cleavage/methylation domain-containing protein